MKMKVNEENYPQIGPGESPRPAPDTRFSFKRIDEECYEVRFREPFAVLGVVYRDRDAWSYGQWFVEGIPQRQTLGGVNAKRLKAIGWTTRAHAAGELAMRQSSVILKALTREGQS